MKSPAFQFYPGDWLRDLNLQSCSLRARGLWFEMLCLMHDGTPYGHLADAKGTITGRKLNKLVHAKAWEVRRDLKELEDHNVFSRTSDGVIFSRRMVRDAQLRQVRAEYGRLGGHDHETAVAYGKRGGRPRKLQVEESKNPLEGGFENPLDGGSDGGYTKTPPASASALKKERTSSPTSPPSPPGPPEGSRPTDSDRHGLDELHEQEAEASRKRFAQLVTGLSERIGFKLDRP